MREDINDVAYGPSLAQWILLLFLCALVVFLAGPDVIDMCRRAVDRWELALIPPQPIPYCVQEPE